MKVARFFSVTLLVFSLTISFAAKGQTHATHYPFQKGMVRCHSEILFFQFASTLNKWGGYSLDLLFLAPNLLVKAYSEILEPRILSPNSEKQVTRVDLLESYHNSVAENDQRRIDLEKRGCNFSQARTFSLTADQWETFALAVQPNTKSLQ